MPKAKVSIHSRPILFSHLRDIVTASNRDHLIPLIERAAEEKLPEADRVKIRNWIGETQRSSTFLALRRTLILRAVRRCLPELWPNIDAAHNFCSNITGGSPTFAKTLPESREIIEHLVKFCRIFLEQHNLTKILPQLLREVFPSLIYTHPCNILTVNYHAELRDQTSCRHSYHPPHSCGHHSSTHQLQQPFQYFTNGDPPIVIPWNQSVPHYNPTYYPTAQYEQPRYRHY
ncbi:hypothetical protein B0H10DRAFT_1971063 [Mycena sp. CBHHK59/15]|nr:hypothetical protein B0H10DRAFT_1971063 [Mycena sp. CBHHK59/15]